jgi:hypothetical protein
VPGEEPVCVVARELRGNHTNRHSKINTTNWKNPA